MDQFCLWTDGSVNPNPGPGGWAYRVICHPSDLTVEERIIHEDSGAEFSTTNNRMEMTAIIQGLRWAFNFFGGNRRKITVYSDSAYIINCFNQLWYKKWPSRGWKNSNKKPLENIDLWEQLIELHEKLLMTWTHIAGHSGVFHNERCDEMANHARIRLGGLSCKK